MDKRLSQAQEIEELRSRLNDAEETLRAIRSGEVDALIVDTGEGEQVFTLKTAETAYRVAIESINEGVLTLSTDGMIIYANCAMGYLLNTPLEMLTGLSVFDFTDGANAETLNSMLQTGSGRHEISFKAAQGMSIPALVSIVALPLSASPTLTLVAVVTDLTELKRRDEVIAQGKLLRESQEKLRESEERFRAVQENSLDRFTILKPFRDDRGEIIDFTYIFQNAQAARLSGQTPEELVGKRLTEIYPAFPRTNFFTVYKQVAETGEGTRFEDHYSADGVDEWFRVTVTPIPNGIAVATQIITERKQAEKALRDSEARFRSLFENSLDAMFITVPDGQVLDANPAACAMFGISKEEFQRVGRSATNPVNKKLVTEVITERKRLGHVRAEMTYARKDGSVIETDTSSVVFNDINGQERSFVIIRDITEQKKVERTLSKVLTQLQNIIDNTTSVVYAFDLEERFIIVNKPLAELLHATPEQMIGKRRHHFMPEANAHWHEENDRKVFEAGKAMEFEEYSQLNGRSITWLTTKYPLRDAEGKIYAVGGISADISERKQMEAELAKAKENLEEQVEERTHDLWTQVETTKRAEAELRALSFRMILVQEEERRSIAKELHDEIGQTLTVLKLMAGSLNKMVPEELKPRVDAINKELTDVMGHVRLMSQSLRPTVLDDLGLVPGLEWLFARLKEQAGLQIEFECPKLKDLEQNVSITAYRIIQESLTNVMRHSGVKSAFVQISFDNDNNLRIRVTDYGRGFNAVGLQTSTGLSAMKERAKLVGGKVELDSAPGKGTVVMAVLPLP